MNIFYLHSNTRICAEQHVDKHCIKMILEYSQLLSTAHRFLDGQEITEKTSNGRNIKRWKLEDEREQILYKATHINHPSAIWCRKSRSNYVWLHDLLTELSKEYTYRYGKIHKCEEIGLIEILSIVPRKLLNCNKRFTAPTPAMPADVKVYGDSLSSYRNYYMKNKTHLASWSGKIASRSNPDWFLI